VLKDEVPSCQLERLSIDLTDQDARQKLFDRVNRQSKKVFVITEGLLVYLDPKEVIALAGTMSKFSNFSHWMMDLASPGLVNMMNKKMGDKLEAARAPFRFGPVEGPGFFDPYGWAILEVHSFLKTAAALKRVNLWMRFLALLPESSGRQGSRPWSAVCLFENGKLK
jgi:O-methyltransferase involved in polyketide biosynthesis